MSARLHRFVKTPLRVSGPMGELFERPKTKQGSHLCGNGTTESQSQATTATRLQDDSGTSVTIVLDTTTSSQVRRYNNSRIDGHEPATIEVSHRLAV